MCQLTSIPDQFGKAYGPYLINVPLVPHQKHLQIDLMMLGH